jgi:serine/threonine protein kinase
MKQESEHVKVAGPSDSATTATGGVAVAVKSGKSFGHYHVLRVIAEGGMGTVYEAVQDNPRRAVALKTLKESMIHPRALRRFEYESQVLARLRHPNIAQIYEAGMHVEGGRSIPYFAMEYIPNARAIDKYVETERLGVRDILALFVEVCLAVHHGHQKGIIHRDLKPANILVDGDGHVKVIDFGVARSSDSDLALTTAQTHVGEFLGTLKYMSPEQCRADPHDIDIRSDIYALGVVLYELLTRHMPYDLSAVQIAMIPRIICEVDATPPQIHSRTFRGDIELILLTALAKDRNQRYESCHAMALDIQRHLNGEPILAEPPSLSYILKKFVNKHWRGLAAMVGIIVALAASGYAFAQVRETARKAARNEAYQHVINAQAASDKDDIDELFSQSNRAIALNPDLPMAYALRARAYLRTKQMDRAWADCMKALELDPSQSFAHRLLGHLYVSKGDYSQALDAFDRGIQGVMPSTVVRFELSMAEDFYQRASLLRKEGRLEEALIDHDRSVALALKVPFVYISRGITRRFAGDIDGAIEDFERAVKLEPQKWTEQGKSWIWETLMLRNEPGDREVAEKALAEARQFAGDHLSSLEQMVLGILTGETSTEDALAAKGANWLPCVVSYYLGARRLVDGNEAEAREYFTRCVEAGQLIVKKGIQKDTLPEHELAHLHLRRLDGRTAQAPGTRP